MIHSEQVANYYFHPMTEPGFSFVDTKTTFDLLVDDLDFKGYNVVWISCESVDRDWKESLRKNQ